MENSDFWYSIQNNEINIISYIGSSSDVIIPQYIEGLLITSFSENFFNNNSFITSVSIPSTIKELPIFAF